MKRFNSLTALVTLFVVTGSVHAADWGKMVSGENETGTLFLRLSTWPKQGKLILPTPANITQAYLQSDRNRKPLPVLYSNDAKRIEIQLPHKEVKLKQPVVVLETVENTTQYADGRIAFSALDAKVNGRHAKLETNPGSHRIGFWTAADEFVSWDYSATRTGMYQVELTYSLSDGDGTKVAVEFAGKQLPTELPTTGSWYQYTTHVIGKVYVEKSGKQKLNVKCLEKIGVAVMNLKAVTLRPVSEGRPILQAKDGSVVCHARDVTIHGVRVRYEPNPKKNTVGYWTNERDTIFWEFTADRTGKYSVELLQGCGKGHGGSEVELRIGKQALRFIVEDTGHFQNFKPRVIGAVELPVAGGYRMDVKPIRKAKVAVMDIRQVRLIPVDDEGK